MPPNVFKCLQMSPNISKCLQMSPNVSIETFSPYRLHQSLIPNVLPVQTKPNLNRTFATYHY